VVSLRPDTLALQGSSSAAGSDIHHAWLRARLAVLQQQLLDKLAALSTATGEVRWLPAATHVKGCGAAGGTWHAALLEWLAAQLMLASREDTRPAWLPQTSAGLVADALV
jgi:hypothetical protein